MLGRGGFEVTAAPREIKVIPNGGGEGLDGRLVARDSERDLAWVQVEEGVEALGSVALDFAGGAELSAGDRFYRLRRMDKFFGSAPVVTEGVVAAVIEKPRKLLTGRDLWSAEKSDHDRCPSSLGTRRRPYVVVMTVVAEPSLGRSLSELSGGNQS